MNRKAIGWAIQVIRAWRRKTQLQVATSAGITQGCVSEVERGRWKTGIPAIKSIAAALDSSLEEILRVADELQAGKWKP